MASSRHSLIIVTQSGDGGDDVSAFKEATEGIAGVEDNEKRVVMFSKQLLDI